MQPNYPHFPHKRIGKGKYQKIGGGTIGRSLWYIGIRNTELHKCFPIFFLSGVPVNG